MKKKKQKTEQVIFKIEPAFKKKLQFIALKNDTDLSTMIRELLEKKYGNVEP